MSDDTLASVLAAAAAFGGFTIAGLVKRADRKRILACLAAQSCSHCARIYGHGIADAVTTVKYHWLLAPRRTVASLGLPRATYLVTCPACDAESELREDGRIFVHPQVGVLDFTRTGKSPSPLPRVVSR